MASSGSFTTGTYQGRGIKFSWSVKSQSVADNTTTISYTVAGTGSATYSWYMAGPVTVVINGTTVYSSSTRFKLYNGTTIKSGTVTISHGSDGTKKFSASVKAAIYTYAVNCTGSSSWSLPTIARVSSPSVSSSSVMLTNSVKISTNRKSSSLTHTLKYTYGSITAAIATGVGASYTWTPPITLISSLGGVFSGTLTITCITYSGSTKVGSDTCTLKFTSPAKTTPTVSPSSVAIGGSVTIKCPRNHSSYTHTLKYTIGSYTGTIATGVSTSQAWTVLTSLAQYFTSTSATITITCTTYYGTYSHGSATVTFTATLSATTPTLSTNSVNVGNSVTISMPRVLSTLTHTLTYSVGDYSGTIGTSLGTSKSWKVPVYLMNAITSSSAKVTITCTTYYGSTSLGSKTVTLTISKNSNVTEIDSDMGAYKLSSVSVSGSTLSIGFIDTTSAQVKVYVFNSDKGAYLYVGTATYTFSDSVTEVVKTYTLSSDVIELLSTGAKIKFLFVSTSDSKTINEIGYCYFKS